MNAIKLKTLNQNKHIVEKLKTDVDYEKQ
jgi:hypothetical protein